MERRQFVGAGLAAAGAGMLGIRPAAAQAKTIRDCDAIVLAQFTLSRAVPVVQQVSSIPVFNSPGAAVAKLRRMVKV